MLLCAARWIRERNYKFRPGVLAACYVYCTVRGGDDLPDECEPKPVALGGVGVVALIELVEYPVDIGFGNGKTVTQIEKVTLPSSCFKRILICPF